eukprot:scaffold121349_cov33-Tisochrysis_lutea.AAC.1
MYTNGLFKTSYAYFIYYPQSNPGVRQQFAAAGFHPLFRPPTRQVEGCLKRRGMCMLVSGAAKQSRTMPPSQPEAGGGG